MNSKPLTEKQFIRWQKLMKLFRTVFHCHQLKERSFMIANRQFPLCARCTGLLLGSLVLGPIFCYLLPINLHISLLLITILLVDGETQLLNFRESNNILRLVTGLGAGYALDSLLVLVVIHTYQLIIH